LPAPFLFPHLFLFEPGLSFPFDFAVELDLAPPFDFRLHFPWATPLPLPPPAPLPLPPFPAEAEPVRPTSSKAAVNSTASGPIAGFPNFAFACLM